MSADNLEFVAIAFAVALVVRWLAGPRWAVIWGAVLIVGLMVLAWIGSADWPYERRVTMEAVAGVLMVGAALVAFIVFEVLARVVLPAVAKGLREGHQP